MNMNNYDSDVWFLHRKLFHRYVKYHECFDRATEAIPSYRKLVDDPVAKTPVKKEEKPKSVPLKMDIINLLTSSSEEEEDDSDEASASA